MAEKDFCSGILYEKIGVDLTKQLPYMPVLDPSCIMVPGDQDFPAIEPFDKFGRILLITGKVPQKKQGISVCYALVDSSDHSLIISVRVRKSALLRYFLVSEMGV